MLTDVYGNPLFAAREPAQQHASALGLVDLGHKASTPVKMPKGYKRQIDQICRNPVVQRCTDIIQSAVTRTVWQVYAPDGQPVESDPLNKVLAKPNPNWSAAGFFAQLAQDYMFRRSAFFYASLVRGRVDELWRMDPDQVSVKYAKTDGEIESFIYGEGKDKETFPVKDKNRVVIWIRGTSWKDISRPDDILPALWDAVCEYQEVVDFERSFMRRGGLATLLSVKDQKLTQEQQDSMRSNINSRVQGHTNAGSVMLASGELTKVEIGAEPGDTRAKLKRQAAHTIAMVLGVPIMLIDADASTTFNNVSEARLSLVEDTVEPLYVGPIASALSRLCENDCRVVGDTSKLPSQQAKRFERMTRLKDAAGFMTLNEQRAEVGLPPLASCGDKVLVNPNLEPVENVCIDLGDDDPRDANDGEFGEQGSEE